MAKRSRADIAIAPVGDVATWFFPRLIRTLEQSFARAVDVVPPVALPDEALRPERGQYLADALLGALAASKRRHRERLLGVTSVDLFEPQKNFVFGASDAEGEVAVISTRRFEGDVDAASFLRLATAEAVHQLGHTFGLDHCLDPGCVMWPSNTLAESERKGFRFCAHHAVAFGPRAKAG